MIDIPTALGYIGMGMILSAFVLEMIEFWHEHTWGYLWFNVIGSILLAYYAWVGSVIPFLVLNLVWAGFAGYKIIKLSIGHPLPPPRKIRLKPRRRKSR